MAEKKASAAEVEPGSADELARIIMLWIRYSGVPQGVLVHDLSALGLTPARIAQLLAADAGTVRTQKGQKRPAWPKT
jgi:hypothetical protein